MQRVAVGLLTLETARRSLEILNGFSDGLQEVIKVTGRTRQELAGFDKDLKTFASTATQSIDRLYGIAKAAGAVGVIDPKNLSLFTRNLAELEEILPDLPGAEAAEPLARLLNIAGEGQDEVDKLTAALVRLRQGTSAVGNEVLNAAQLVGQSTGQFHITSSELVAIGTALSVTSDRVDLAAKVIEQTFVEIDRSVSHGGQQLKQFADIAGVSTEEFATAFRTNAAKGLDLFVQGVGKLVRGGDNIVDVLDSVGLQGAQNGRVFAALANNADLLTRKLAEAGQEHENLKTFAEAAERGEDSLGKAFERLRNAAAVLLSNTTTRKDGGIEDTLKDIVNAGGGALRILAGTATESDKSKASFQNLALAIKAVALAGAGLVAAQLPRAIIGFTSALASSIPLTAALIGGLGLLASGATDFSTALTLVVSVMTALRLAPLIKQAVDGAAAFKQLGKALDDLGSSNLRDLQATQQTLTAKAAETAATVANVKAAQAEALVTQQATVAAQAQAQAELVAAGALVQRTQATLGLLVVERERKINGTDALAALNATQYGEAGIIKIRELLAERTTALAAAQARLDAVMEAGTVSMAAQQAAGTQLAALEAQLGVETAALAAANTRLAASQAAAAAEATIFSRAIAFARATMQSFIASIAANPLGALLVALSLVIPLLIHFRDSANEASDAAKKLAEANERLKGSLAEIDQARARQTIAQQKNDQQGLLEGIEAEADALKRLQIQVELLRKTGGPAVSFDFLKNAKLSDEDIDALKTQMRDKIADAIQTSLSEASTKGDFNINLLSKQFETIKKNIEDTLGNAKLGFKIDEVVDQESLKKAIDEIATTVAFGTRGFQAKLAEQVVADNAENFKKALSPALIAAPIDEVMKEINSGLDHLSDRAKVVQKALEDAKTKAGQQLVQVDVTKTQQEISRALAGLRVSKIGVDIDADPEPLQRAAKILEDLKGKSIEFMTADQKKVLEDAIETVQRFTDLRQRSEELQTQLQSRSLDGLEEQRAANEDLYKQALKRIELIRDELAIFGVQSNVVTRLLESLTRAKERDAERLALAKQLQQASFDQETLDLREKIAGVTKDIAEQLGLAGKVDQANATANAARKDAIQKQLDTEIIKLKERQKVEGLTDQQIAERIRQLKDEAKGEQVLIDAADRRLKAEQRFNATSQVTSLQNDLLKGLDQQIAKIEQARVEANHAAEDAARNDSAKAANLAKVLLLNDAIAIRDKQDVRKDSQLDDQERVLNLVQRESDHFAFQVKVQEQLHEIEVERLTVQLRRKGITEEEIAHEVLLLDLAHKQDQLRAAASEANRTSAAVEEQNLLDEALRRTNESFAKGEIEAEHFSEALVSNITKVHQEISALFTGIDAGIADALHGFADNFSRGLEYGRSAIQAFHDEGASAFSDFISGAKSGEDALESFGRAFSKHVLDLASSALFDQITTGLLGTGAKAAEGAAQGAALTTAAAAAGASLTAATTAGGLALTTAGTTAGATMATAITTAAAALVTAATTAASILATSSAAGAAGSGATGFLASAGIFARGGVLPHVTALAQGGTIDRGVSATIAAAGAWPVAAAGQVVTSPQFLVGEGSRPEGVFPLDKTTGGKLGVMAQLEDRNGQLQRSVLQLSRMADGNLGVRVPPQRRLAVGGTMGDSAGFDRFPAGGSLGVDQAPSSQGTYEDRRPTIVTNTNNMTVVARDADSFRRSQRQIDQARRRRTGG